MQGRQRDLSDLKWLLNTTNKAKDSLTDVCLPSHDDFVINSAACKLGSLRQSGEFKEFRREMKRFTVWRQRNSPSTQIKQLLCTIVENKTSTSSTWSLWPVFLQNQSSAKRHFWFESTIILKNNWNTSMSGSFVWSMFRQHAPADSDATGLFFLVLPCFLRTDKPRH